MTKVIIWADDVDLATPVAKDLRAQGHAAMTRDARGFNGVADAERCEAIAFVAASKRDEIIAAYRSEFCVDRFGQVQVFDVETGKFGEALSAITLPPPPPPAPTEKDFLSDRIDNMSDTDLRTYVRGVTGAEISADATREDLEALLRDGKPSEAKGGAKPDPAPQPPAQPPEGEGASPPAAETAPQSAQEPQGAASGDKAPKPAKDKTAKDKAAPKADKP